MAGDTWMWIEPDGSQHTLDGQNGIHVNYGRRGGYMPDVALVTAPLPTASGSFLRHVRFNEREYDVPLIIHGETPSILRQRIRDLLRWVNPLRGDGRLRVVAPDGVQRELVCRYQQGLEGLEERIMLGNIIRATLTVLAFDPLWQSVSESSEIFLLDNTTATFFPIFPLRLTSETIFADTNVTNNGDDITWPVWSIWGPGTNPTITNLNTGERIALTYTLTPGETVTIDTRPGMKTVMTSSDVSLFEHLSDDSVLWALPQDDTAIRVEMTDATDASQVNLRFRERWLSS